MTFYDEELDEFLIEKLKLIEPTSNRDPEIANQSRDQYIKRVKFLPIKSSIFAFTGLFNRKTRLGTVRSNPILVPLAATILVIFGLVFGSVGTVYAAQDSLPNELLYSVKLTGERLQLAYTTETKARIALLATFTGHRIEEARRLSLRGQPIPEELPELMDAQLEDLFTLIDSLDEASQQEALKGIQVHLRDQDQDMTNAMKNQPEDVDPQLVQLREMLQARQQLVQMGLGEPNTNQHNFRYQHNVLTETITSTLTTTETVTQEISGTLKISPGLYGPGPCESPDECIPPGDVYGPGPFEGESPVSEDHERYGPGPNKELEPQQPIEKPKTDESQKPTEPTNNSGNEKGKKDKP